VQDHYFDKKPKLQCHKSSKFEFGVIILLKCILIFVMQL